MVWYLSNDAVCLNPLLRTMCHTKFVRSMNAITLFQLLNSSLTQ